MIGKLSEDQIQALRQIDTCTVANAIESFNRRLRNEGYTNSSVRCLFPEHPAMVGYAVTVTMCSASPPPMGERNYLDRTDWWQSLMGFPAPRIVVIQDVDEQPGSGSLLGAVHCAILRSLGCVGAVTNGAVRDVHAVRASGFSLFASQLAASHAYAHVVSIGEKVKVGGLDVRSGDLLHGDAHGVISVPMEVAAAIPEVAKKMIEQDNRVIALCESKEFTIEKLRAAISASH